MTLLRRRMLGAVLGLAVVAGTAQAGGGGAPSPSQATCGPAYVRPDFAALGRELAAARARWALAGIGDYAYDFGQVAAPVLFPTVRVEVRGGKVRSAALMSGEDGPLPPLARATVEGRFGQIAQTLILIRRQPCPVVEAEYDPQLGYPTRFYSGSGEANVADGWGEWRVTTFTRGVPGGP